MKKIVLFLVVSALLPFYSFAHGPMMNFGDITTGPEMMRYVEDKAVGADAHQEMEELMIKMMSGKMSEEEANILGEMMKQYPGSYGMMMNRISVKDGSSWNMMSGWNQAIGWGIIWLWVIMLSWFVWLVVGALLIIWLVKRIFGLNK